MSNLFYLPRVRSEPGAKLYFRQSGTSTPQNTYTDIDLSVAHSNPVVADADGYFDPIYLDPSLPNYRVIHTDGSNEDDDPTMEVELAPTQDDVPGSSTGAQEYRVKGSAPAILFEETDASADNGKWRISSNGQLIEISLLDDAESTATQVLTISRSGTSVGDVRVNGVSILPSSGTFGFTLTGLTSAGSGTGYYTVIGKLAIVTLTATFGTSNSTAATITGIPAAIQSSRSQIIPIDGSFYDNGAWASDVGLNIGTSSTWTFNKAGVSSGFTAANTKGFLAGITIAYPL